MKRLLILPFFASLVWGDTEHVIVKLTDTLPYAYTIDSGKKIKIERVQDTSNRLTDDYTRWDLSVTQKLPWAGLQVYCNVTNLSGAIEREHLFANGGNGIPSSASHYGTAIYAGVRLRTE